MPMSDLEKARQELPSLAHVTRRMMSALDTTITLAQQRAAKLAEIMALLRRLDAHIIEWRANIPPQAGRGTHYARIPSRLADLGETWLLTDVHAATSAREIIIELRVLVRNTGVLTTQDREAVTNVIDAIFEEMQDQGYDWI